MSILKNLDFLTVLRIRICWNPHRFLGFGSSQYFLIRYRSVQKVILTIIATILKLTATPWILITALKFAEPEIWTARTLSRRIVEKNIRGIRAWLNLCYKMTKRHNTNTGGIHQFLPTYTYLPVLQYTWAQIGLDNIGRLWKENVSHKAIPTHTISYTYLSGVFIMPCIKCRHESTYFPRTWVSTLFLTVHFQILRVNSPKFWECSPCRHNISVFLWVHVIPWECKRCTH